uniref:Uncharacterized protein n=1 Tax=Anolis carolinensis TaxID=28377 RepID=A0A803SMX2_ANOCA
MAMKPLGSLTIFLGICIICLVFFTLKRNFIRNRKLPHGPTLLPIIGNALQLKANHLDLTLHEVSGKINTIFGRYSQHGNGCNPVYTPPHTHMHLSNCRIP